MHMAMVEGVLRVQFRFTLASTIACSNTFHISKGTSISPSELKDVADALGTFSAGSIAQTYLNMMCATDMWDTINVSEVPDPSTPEDPPGVYIKNIVVPGTRSTPSPTGPAELTPTMTIVTGYASRRRRGRLFLPGPRSTAVLTGELFDQTNAYWTAVSAFQTAFRTLIAGASGHPSGALTDYDLSVYSEVEQLQNPPGTTHATNTRLNLKSHWLRSRAS